MSDLVVRLRKSALDCEGEDRLDLSGQAAVEREAADEIERLQRLVILEDKNDLRRNLSNGKTNSGGAREGGMVLCDADGEIDLRGATQSPEELAQARLHIIGVPQ